MLIRMTYRGGDRFEVVPADRAKLERFHEGTVAAFEHKKPRSRPQNRRLFALIERAWLNDPTDRWVGPEHLRAWLFCKANFKETVTIERSSSIATISAAIMAIVTRVRAKLTGGYVFLRETEDTVEVDIPQSWAFDRTDHPVACRVMNEVEDLIVTEVVPGTTIQQLWESVEKDAT